MNAHSPNLLLVVSTTRESPKTIEHAFKKAEALHAKLVVLCVIDTSLPASIVDQLADSGFVGEKPSEAVYEKILAEYKQRGELKLREIQTAATSRNIDVKPILKEGDWVEHCLQVIEEEEIAQVIIGRKKRSKLSNFIFGSPIRQIQKSCHCPVELVEEEE